MGRLGTKIVGRCCKLDQHAEQAGVEREAAEGFRAHVLTQIDLMTICPHTRHQCHCQPDEGVFCPYGIDVHDPAGMVSYLRERARANRELASVPVDKWPRFPDVARHVALRLDQAADMLERLAGEPEKR